MIFPHQVEDYYLPFFFEGIDRIVNGIEMRFDQPGFQTYKKLENVLLKAANKESYDDDIEFITQLYGSDLNLQQLKLHLNILSSILPQSSIAYDLSSIVEFIKKLSPIQKALIPQVHCLVSLVLVMPATNATSERSFSALRRVKTFLRTTMTQLQLNNAMILFVHRNLTDKINLVELGNEFIRGSEPGLPKASRPVRPA